MSLAFLNLQLGIRTDGVKLFLYDILTFEEPFLHYESVTLLARMLFDKLRHHGKCFLFAIRLKAFIDHCVLKTHGNGYVYMAVDDAGHDELAAEVGDFSFVIGKTCFVAHINEFAVLHHEGGCHWVVLVRGENLCVFDDLICFHRLINFY